MRCCIAEATEQNLMKFMMLLCDDMQSTSKVLIRILHYKPFYKTETFEQQTGSVQHMGKFLTEKLF